jgi:hypothetical protein
VGTLIISIHAPHVEGDPPIIYIYFIFFYFNPRPPRGGRQQN